MFSRTKLLMTVALVAVLCLPAVSEAQFRGRGYGGGYGGRYYGGGYGYGRYGSGYGGYRSGGYVGIGNGYYGGYQNGYYNNGAYYAPAVIDSQPVNPSYQSFYPPTSNGTPAQTSDGTALITVTLPANAQLTWNGLASSAMGPTRLFRTAPLGADGAMQTFQARWAGPDGQAVTQSREVRVMPNGAVTVDFNQPAATTASPPTQQ